jgi:hypothetical protein
MKAVKRYYKKAVPALAIFAVVVIALVVSRAVSIARNEGTPGVKVPAASFLKYVWLELKNVLKYSRYQ